VAFTGNRLVVGAPDAGAGGAVSIFGRNEGAAAPLVPAALPEGVSVDFGAATAG
jgi:hypothetical protein